MRHPREAQLALLAGGDRGWWERWSVARHVNRCGECRAAVESHEKARQALVDLASALPDGERWERLAAEMTANIRVGLAAGECVGPAPDRARHGLWKPGLAIAGLSLVVVSGWWLNFPREQKQSLTNGIERLVRRQPVKPLADQSVYLEMSRSGIRLSEGGSAMTLMHPGAAPSAVSVNLQGSIRASYVDDDTGQVTITNVYAQ